MTDQIVQIDAFAKHPGGRYKKDGEYSGEAFRDDILAPALENAIAANQKLSVVLDGTAGYASSFLEEVFGGLARSHRFTVEQLKQHLLIVARQPLYNSYKGLAERYLKDALGRQAQAAQ